MSDSANAKASRLSPPRGRPFIDGNPGRRPGSRNRATVIASALLEGEAEELLRKAIELAKGGDAAMLKFLLGRMLPRDRLIKVDLGRMDFADDAVEAMSTIIDAVSEGKVSPGEAAALATLVKFYAEAIDLADVVKRLDVLEAQIKEGRR
jgi:hypothetical protein